MIKFYTIVHKRPDFLPLQLLSFKKYLKHPFELIVFNNATYDKNQSNFNQTQKWCKENNIQHIIIEKDQNILSQTSYQIFGDEYHPYMSASLAGAYPLCYTWTNIISKTNDKICIIDGDMFFMNSETDIDRLLNEYDIIFHPQSRDDKDYIWNNLVAINLATIPNKQDINWWCGNIEGANCDVGGMTYYWLKNNSPKILHWTQNTISIDNSVLFQPPNYEYFGHNSKSILHLRGGNNWDRKSKQYWIYKTEWLHEKLEVSPQIRRHKFTRI